MMHHTVLQTPTGNFTAPGVQLPWPDSALRPTTTRRPVRFAWILFIAALLLCAYCLFRQTPLPIVFAHSDKVAHAGAFLILVLFAYLACARLSRVFFLLLTTLLLLAIGSEWIQGTALLPQRQGDLWDLLANLGGWGLGLLGAAWMAGDCRDATTAVPREIPSASASVRQPA